MKNLLTKFDTVLQKYNPINYAALKPPLPQKEVEAYMDSWGIRDENLKELLSWKNGFDFRGRTQNKIFKWGAFLSVELINEYITGDYDDEPQIDAEGNRIFIPLTENGSGDTLLYNLKKRELGRIHLFSVPLLFIDEPISYYDSIATMLETEIAAYENEAYEIDSESGRLKSSNKIFFPLAKKLNTKSEYWKQV